MIKKKTSGRPRVHDLKVLTPHCIRRARLELTLGKTRTWVGPSVFRISPKTLKRYLAEDDPRSLTTKHALELGESLRKEPLGLLICYFYDSIDLLIAKKLKMSGDVTERESDLMKEIESLYERIKETYELNETLKTFVEHVCRFRNRPRVEGLGAALEFVALHNGEVS